MSSKKARPALRLPEGTRGVTGIGDMSPSEKKPDPSSLQKKESGKKGASPGASEKTQRGGAGKTAEPDENSFTRRPKKEKITKLPRTYMLHEETVAGLEYVKEEHGITISSYVQKVLAAALKRDFDWPPED